jgi:hypothetical protein
MLWLKKDCSANDGDDDVELDDELYLLCHPVVSSVVILV